MALINQLSRASIIFNQLMNSKPKIYSNIDAQLNSTSITNIYVSSDLHFGGAQTNEYNIKIAHNNQLITNDKILIYLGDLGHKKCEDREFIKSCAQQLSKGKFSVFICGNHDIYEPSFYTNECGFSIYCKEGFMWRNLCFTHMPVTDENNPKNLINIHGHLHSKTIDTEPYYNGIRDNYKNTTYIRVFNELNNFYPQQLSKLLIQNHRKPL